MTTLSEFKTAAISYIAGYVVQMVKKKVTCSTYCEALSSTQYQPECKFIALKGRGKLVKPTPLQSKFVWKQSIAFNGCLKQLVESCHKAKDCLTPLLQVYYPTSIRQTYFQNLMSICLTPLLMITIHLYWSKPFPNVTAKLGSTILGNPLQNSNLTIK